MGPLGAVVFVIGAFAFILGILLLFMVGISEHGLKSIRYGKFSLPIWFIFIAIGFVLMIVGLMQPV